MTDGVVVRRPYFNDGDKKYAVKLDSETKLTGADGGALFEFEKFAGATMRLRQSPVRGRLELTNESLPSFLEAAKSLLPPGAEEVALVETTPNPLPINNWQSYRFTFSYKALNEKRRQSVTFLDLKPGEQIIIQTTSNERDFAQISARAFNIIRRWHEVVPEDQSF